MTVKSYELRTQIGNEPIYTNGSGKYTLNSGKIRVTTNDSFTNAAKEKVRFRVENKLNAYCKWIEAGETQVSGVGF